MLYFENDYSEGACKEVLDELIKTNYESTNTYGFDKYSDAAKEKIKKACGINDGDVFFLIGGTGTNKTVIASLLKNYESVISANTGHINIHEAGAIENSGHKIIGIPHIDGKINLIELKKYLNDFYNDSSFEHMTIPGMIYISHPTEYGTLYTKEELKSLSDICKEYKLKLYLDGARLGYGLSAKGTNVTLKDIAKFCDVFYIGGTKVGALFGEAVVFTRNTPSHFIATIKQNGSLLAKGRLLGVQFNKLFSNNLYLKISKKAINYAEILKKALIDKGYNLFIDSPTNQIFVILENNKIAKLEKNVKFSLWEKYDENHTVIRFVTSWSTDEDKLKRLINYL